MGKQSSLYTHTHAQWNNAIRRHEMLIHATMVDELWKHGKWNMPETKGQILWFCFYESSRIDKFIEKVE